MKRIDLYKEPACVTGNRLVRYEYSTIGAYIR